MERILKQKLNRRKENDNASAIKSFIEQIERGEVPKMGEGHFKTAYEKDGLIYLREEGPKETVTYTKATEFYRARKIAKMLKDYGVATPDLIYYTNKPSAEKGCVTQYSVVEKKEGKPLDRFNINLGYRGIKLLKERALYGQKFMPKFLRDFSFLVNSGIIWDFNGENYLFDKEKGYSFIDIDFHHLPAGLKSIEDIERHIKENSVFDVGDALSKHNVEFRASTYRDFAHQIMKPLYLDAVSQDARLESYIYRGIIFAQFEQMMKTYSRKFQFEDPKDIDRFFIYSSNNIIDNIALPLQTLEKLYDLFKSGESTSPEIVEQINLSMKFAHTFGRLPSDFDFSKAINSEEFMQAMATLENPNFDFSFMDTQSQSQPDVDMEQE